MHCFIHAQAFLVRPIQNRRAQTAHFFRTLGRCEAHEFRFRCRLDKSRYSLNGRRNPRDHHRPCFNAAQPINAFFEIHLQNVFNPDGFRLCNFAGNFNGPRADCQRIRIAGGVGLSGTEFVEIIIGRCELFIRCGIESLNAAFGRTSAARTMSQLLRDVAERMQQAARLSQQSISAD